MDDSRLIVLGSAGFIILGVLGIAIPELGIALLVMLGLLLSIAAPLIYFLRRN